MLKKWTDRIFCLLFALLLIAPLVTMNFQKGQISEIDNAYLPELQFSPTRQFLSEVEDYVNVRMGFRTEILDLYQQLNAKIFGIMEHPLYMYGENGQVFFKLPKYIEDYQHLNLDPVWAASYTDEVCAMRDTANAHGADFLYLLIPDKKTVYAEDFPQSINVSGDISLMDLVLAELEAADVEHFYVKDAMLAAKAENAVCNRQYDAGHWNEHGAIAAYSALFSEKLPLFLPEIEPLDPAAFSMSYQHVYTLPVSRFIIHEETPHYEPLHNTAVRDDSLLDEYLPDLEKDLYDHRYIDAENAEKPKLLVLHDSYMIEHEKFFTGQFSEMTFIHYRNLSKEGVYERILAAVQPNLVIFETAERCFPLTFKEEEQGE